MSALVHREHVSISEAAKLARVSRRTIYNWLAKGLLQVGKSPGGITRIFTDSLLVAYQPVATPAAPSRYEFLDVK